MPIPTPRRDEDREKFVARCMRDGTMRREFSDESQRAAVCFRQWRQRKRASAEAYTSPLAAGALSPADIRAWEQTTRPRSAWTPLIGLWAVLPEWMQAHHAQIEALQDNQRLYALPSTELHAKAFSSSDLIQRGPHNLAVIPLHGPMIKRAGFFEQLFGFTGADTVREALELASMDPEIRGIMLSVESPGGHVAGVNDLSDAVRRATAFKPVAVHIDDLGASAAYWASAYASRITASATSEIGSLGTMAVIADTSQLAASAGIKVHVVSTGAYKGLGVPGTPIDAAHLEEIHRRVESVNRFFMQAVRSGRNLTPEQLTQVADGRVFIAQDAKRLGLIDDVRSMGAALRDLSRLVATGRAGDTRAQIAARRHALEDCHDGDSGDRQAQDDAGE